MKQLEPERNGRNLRQWWREKESARNPREEGKVTAEGGKKEVTDWGDTSLLRVMKGEVIEEGGGAVAAAVIYIR